MPSSRPFLVDLPRVAREGPEATPLTSHASTFWLSPSADSQPDSELPQGLAALWAEKTTSCAADLFGPSSHLENRERVALAEPTVSGGLRNFTRSLHSPAIAG